MQSGISQRKNAKMKQGSSGWLVCIKSIKIFGALVRILGGHWALVTDGSISDGSLAQKRHGLHILQFD